MYTRRAFAQQKKVLSLTKKLIIGLCLVLVYLFFWISWTGDVGIKAYKKVTIPAGATAGQLDTILEFPVSHTRYRLWKALFGPTITLKQGTYQIAESVTTIRGVFEALRNPVAVEDDVMLLPGWHKGEVSEALKKKAIIGDLLTEEAALIAKFSPKYPFLAGKTSLE
jgi:cell division protein YceG involved in septum cleavage